MQRLQQCAKNRVKVWSPNYPVLYQPNQIADAEAAFKQLLKRRRRAEDVSDRVISELFLTRLAMAKRAATPTATLADVG